MKCQYCGEDFEEKDIDESHDVPCYLFEGNRKGQKTKQISLEDISFAGNVIDIMKLH